MERIRKDKTTKGEKEGMKEGKTGSKEGRRRKIRGYRK